MAAASFDYKRRVTNGHGISTSVFSVTHLGSHARPPPYQMPVSEYRAEALAVSNNVKRRHGPALANLHYQKSFPETRRMCQPPFGRLSEMETPRELKDVSFPPHNQHKTKWERKDVPFAKSDPGYVKGLVEGRDFGNGHRQALAHRSHQTDVNYIISQQDKNGASFRPGSFKNIKILSVVISISKNVVPPLLLWVFA
jgi:hypothetical protein